MPKYLFGQPIGKLVKTNPHLPVKLQRWLARPLPFIASGRMEDFGLPHPNHEFLEAHPTVSSELLLRLGLRRRGGEAERRRADGRPGRLRGRQRRGDRRDRLRDGLQDHLPVLRPGVPLGARQPAAALQAHLRAGHRRPGVGRVRPGDSDAVPVRRAAEQARRPIRRRRLRAPLGRRRWSGRSTTTSPSTASSPSAPATRCRSTGTSTSTTSGSASFPPAASAPSGAWRAKLAGRAERDGARPCLSARDVSFASGGETCAAWHFTGEGDAFASERGRPCVVMAHGIGGTRDSGPRALRRGLRRGGPRRRSSSTTGTSAPRPASPASSAGRPATATTTAPRSRSPAASKASIRIGSSSGEPRGRAATSSTSPPTTPGSPR